LSLTPVGQSTALQQPAAAAKIVSQAKTLKHLLVKPEERTKPYAKALLAKLDQNLQQPLEGAIDTHRVALQGAVQDAMNALPAGAPLPDPQLGALNASITPLEGATGATAVVQEPHTLFVQYCNM
jgi:hypothetical protein